MSAKAKKYIHVALSKDGNRFKAAFTLKRLAGLYIKQHSDCYLALVELNDMRLFSGDDESRLTIE